MEQRSKWKFGTGQTIQEERAEIRAAQRAGLECEYLEAQRWARLIEAEAERKRARRRRQR